MKNGEFEMGNALKMEDVENALIKETGMNLL